MQLEHDDSSIRQRSYRIHLDSLLRSLPGLEVSKSLLSDESISVTSTTIAAEFALILSKLRVPGPNDLHNAKVHIGAGAQFDVWEQELATVSETGKATVASQNFAVVVAVKTPRFLQNVDMSQRINLSDPNIAIQVREMILEITALRHPRLRDHRNIVDLLGWGLSNDTWYDVPFLALELAHENLSALLDKWTDMPLMLKHHIGLDVACGMDAIHEIGLVHGDLKPENILMFYDTNIWVAKLADFAGSNDMTKTGSLQGRGTVGWRAPELCQLSGTGTKLDLSLLHMVDVYSYGLVVWALFLKGNGAPPCDEESTALAQARRELIIHQPKLPPCLYSALDCTIDGTLSPNPGNRSPKVGHLLNDGSQAYSKWEELTTVYEESSAKEYDVFGDEMLRFEWEIPEVSIVTADALKTVFLKNPDAALSPDMLYALSLKHCGYGPRLLWDSTARDTLLELLTAAARKDHGPSRSMVNLVYEYFDIGEPLDVRQAKVDWMSEAVADGAFFLRRRLGELDHDKLEQAVIKFRSRGGYNHFYALLSWETISIILTMAASDDIAKAALQEPVNDRGDSPLHVLASINEPEALSKLLDILPKEDINQRNNKGEMPLYRACMSGLTSNVCKLLHKGADASIAPLHGGPTCLHWLFQFSRSDIHALAEQLINHGSSVGLISQVRFPMLHYPFVFPVGTPLHWAIEFRVPEAVHALLAQNANPTVRDGQDPYAFDENVRYLDMLVPPDGIGYSKSEHETRGLSSIDLAVKSCVPDILNIVLDKMRHGDQDDVDEEGYTALHRLGSGDWRYTLYGSPFWSPLTGGHPSLQGEVMKDTVEVLKIHNFNIDRLTSPRRLSERDPKFYGQTALMLAVGRGQTDVIDALLQAGANVQVSNGAGSTAMLCLNDNYVFWKDSVQRDVLSLLFAAHADTKVRDMHGCTPLLIAASTCLTVALEVLLARGADIHERVSSPTSLRFGWSALALVAKCRTHEAGIHDRWYSSIVKRYLLPLLQGEGSQTARGEILEKADLDGGSLLHHTAYYGLVDSCSILIETGAKINPLQRHTKVRPERGLKIVYHRTPLDVASNRKVIPKFGKSVYSNTEWAEYLKPFHKISKMFEDAGGVRAEKLVAKEYSSIQS